MNIASPRPQKRALISLTPLIDVVFILLIFFMLATQFLEWTALPLNVPAQSTAPATDVPTLEVRLDSAGTVFVAETQIPKTMLAAELMARVSATPELQIVVRPDPAATLQGLVSIIDAVRLAEPAAMRLVRE